jgi:hypothetical protein
MQFTCIGVYRRCSGVNRQLNSRKLPIFFDKVRIGFDVLSDGICQRVGFSAFPMAHGGLLLVAFDTN